jgi:NADH-quinone oxidoreductase subunit G
LYPALPERVSDALSADTDLVLVWGEGFDSALVPSGAKVIRLSSYAHADNAGAELFIPISVQTERSGHYTNFNGVVTPFEACFPVKPSIVHADALFVALAAGTGA